MDASKTYQLLGQQAKLKVGGSYVYKMRNYEIQNFQFIPFQVALTGDPMKYLLRKIFGRATQAERVGKVRTGLSTQQH